MMLCPSVGLITVTDILSEQLEKERISLPQPNSDNLFLHCEDVSLPRYLLVVLIKSETAISEAGGIGGRARHGGC